jgi:hypothetical protein
MNDSRNRISREVYGDAIVYLLKAEGENYELGYSYTEKDFAEKVSHFKKEGYTLFESFEVTREHLVPVTLVCKEFVGRKLTKKELVKRVKDLLKGKK